MKNYKNLCTININKNGTEYSIQHLQTHEHVTYNNSIIEIQNFNLNEIDFYIQSLCEIKRLFGMTAQDKEQEIKQFNEQVNLVHFNDLESTALNERKNLEMYLPIEFHDRIKICVEKCDDNNDFFKVFAQWETYK